MLQYNDLSARDSSLESCREVREGFRTDSSARDSSPLLGFLNPSLINLSLYTKCTCCTQPTILPFLCSRYIVYVFYVGSAKLILDGIIYAAL